MAECLPATFVSLPEEKKNSSNNVVIQTKTFSVEEGKVNVRAFHLQCRISVVKTPPGRFLQPDSDKCFFLNNTNNQESLSCTGALFLLIYLFFNQK